MNLFTLAILFLLDLTTSSPLLPRQATNGPHPPTILWSCLGNPDPILNIPSVCSNMCYGAYCRGYGSTLTWDSTPDIPPVWMRLSRKWNSGCYVGAQDNETDLFIREDRCEAQGLACSVYPFLTAIDGDKDVKRGGPVSRCVDVGEDARQFAMLNFFYTSTGPWSDNQGVNSSLESPKYHQIFANVGELPYCSGLASDCVTDGAEFDRLGTIFTYDPLPQQQKQRKYRLSGGANITVTQEMEVGRSVLVPKVKNRLRFLELSERRGIERERILDRMGELLYLDVEEVEEEIIELPIYSDRRKQFRRVKLSALSI